MIANCMTPYRANLHALIAAGVPEFKLHTLITHGPADFAWSMEVPESIHASYLGTPDDSPTASPLRAPLRDWRKGARLIAYLRANDVRAVICQGYRYASYLRVIQYCHRNSVCLFVRNDSNIKNESSLLGWKKHSKKWIYSWWMSRVDGVMSMGEYGDHFFRKYGADPERIYRVPYTPDYDYFAQPDHVEVGRFRRRFGLAPGRTYIIYSGRLVPTKRVDLLIDAFAMLASERPNWDLLIVGDGQLRSELQQRVPERLRSRVVWTGFIENRDLVAAYHAAQVLVLPSDREPWALVVQEALAAGLAVVASDVVGAAHEVIRDRVSGRIFPAGDVDALREAMLDITADPSIAAYRQQAQLALANWRGRVDPVAEVRRALADCRLLSASAPQPRGNCEVSV